MEREFGLVVHDVESSAVTLAWNAYKDGAKYEIEIEGKDGNTLKNTISSTMMRKKNLTPASVYTVKVRATTDEQTWTPFCPTVEFTTLSEVAKRMAAPTVMSREETACVMQWEKVEGAEIYEVEMREDGEKGGGAWETVGGGNGVKGEAMRKKNLFAGGAASGCYFRVRPKTVNGGEATEWALSPPSLRVTPASLPPFLSSLLGGPAGTGLIKPDGSPVPIASLAGKAVGLYCSASWCPPCKQYTPMLATFYSQMKGLGKPFEVIFLSCDKDEASFKGYHSKMPWLAVPFGSPARESALATLKVQGIPMLTILGPSGAIAEQNAVQTPLNPATLDRWLRS